MKMKEKGNECVRILFSSEFLILCQSSSQPVTLINNVVKKFNVISATLMPLKKKPTILNQQPTSVYSKFDWRSIITLKIHLTDFLLLLLFTTSMFAFFCRFFHSKLTSYGKNGKIAYKIHMHNRWQYTHLSIFFAFTLFVLFISCIFLYVIRFFSAVVTVIFGIYVTWGFFFFFLLPPPSEKCLFYNT